MKTCRLFLLFLAFAVSLPEPATAEEPGPETPHAACAAGGGDYVDPTILTRSTKLREGIGRVRQKITTNSAEAQAFYDQGLTYLHSYVWIEAARSFHEALRRDPDCAMAWMGLARAEQGMSRKKTAAEAIAKGQELAAGASELERTYVALRAQQIEAEYAPRENEAEKHEAYKRAIEKAIAKYPKEAELWVLRGNAEEPGAWGRG